ncbi:MAG: F-type H+-transporting ATPase subunit gamma [Frankiaceae bacterium]|jgi:F-type H+-transporting ATPase subunit gamma|nr:F-type H+-transporting ATPase subunit gamma [Frankiaceae bacterium]MDQ1699167.1 F-type H+-transporting ATPase subunit gamma [Frankiaceae bacterium]
MGAKLREYRRRIRSVQSTKKITRAMELIAASRIVKAQQRIEQARPYAEAITGVVGTVASQSSTVDHPLTTPRSNPSRAAVLVLASDRGLAGGYSANVLRTAEELNSLVRSEGKEPVPFLVGRKAVGFYRFRGRDISRQWTGFTEQPSYDDAKAVADALIEEFVRGGDDGGVDEIHLVYTQFNSMASQKAVARRMLPMVIEYADDATPEQQAQYEFEPSAEGVLDALLPRYIEARIYAAMLDAAASEQAARRRAMKAATDNADELIKSLTRDANAARQAEITQEIMEIVGGAEALAKSGRE